MRRPCHLLFASLALVAVKPAVGQVVVERLSQRVERGDKAVLRAEVPFGKVTLERSRDTEVRAELVFHCSGNMEPCRTAASQIRFEKWQTEEAQVLGVSGVDKTGKRTRTWFSFPSLTMTKTPKKTRIRQKEKLGPTTPGWKLGAEWHLFYPRYGLLELQVGRGEVSAHLLDSSTSIHVRRGSVDLTIDADAARRVEMRVKMGGHAVLIQPSGRADKSRSLEWAEGRGTEDFSIVVGKGSARVRLR